MTTTRMLDTSHGGIAIAESAGDGPPVLLIHGNSSCKEVFRDQLEGEIGRQYRLIAMALPGHGGSEDARNPEAAYNIPGYADTAGDVLASLGIGSAAVMGWSLGGHIGIDMIGRLPVVRALMLGAFAGGVGADQLKIVESANIPLAIVNGGDDPFVNNGFVESVGYANLWDGQVHILEGVGHAPFWEAPDRFDPIFARFLADVGA